MIIYRVPPFPLPATIVVPKISHEYDFVISDEFGEELFTGTATSDTDGILSFTPPSSKYDADYVLEVTDAGATVLIEPLFVIRPYVSVSGLSTDETEAQRMESISRAVIDAVTNGFYYSLVTYETEGSGSDYLPIPTRVNKLMRVWESGELVFTNGSTNNLRSFAISKDRSSLVVVDDDALESGRPIRTPAAYSDSYAGLTGNRGSFPQGVDYVVEFESGYLVVPNEVTQAAAILAVDVENGDEYLSRYISEYDTDQYKIKFSARVFGGTGNKTVDQLLKKFRDYNVRAGLL